LNVGYAAPRDVEQRAPLQAQVAQGDVRPGEDLLGDGLIEGSQSLGAGRFCCPAIRHRGDADDELLEESSTCRCRNGKPCRLARNQLGDCGIQLGGAPRGSRVREGNGAGDR
jgi:hypothetical protein